MKLTSKLLLAAVILSSGAAYADDLVVRRIEHPNGPATYVTAPAQGRGFVSNDDSGATLGVYAGSRSLGGRDEGVRGNVGLNDAEGRTLVPIHYGRGQTIYTPIQR